MHFSVTAIFPSLPGYQYNVSKSAVVTLTRCIGNEVNKYYQCNFPSKYRDGEHSFQFYFSRTGVKVMCLCPSVAQTPILSGCSKEEIAKMKADVGGLMSPEFVAEALVKLIEDEKNGSVMAAWNKVPPYYIPDTGMALFILFTTTAMIARLIMHIILSTQ